MNVFKRSFWTVSQGTARGKVLLQGSSGLIFKHRHIQVVLQKYGVNNDSVLSWSVEKMPNPPDLQTFVGKTVECGYYQDLFGNPTKGDVLDATYITSIKEVEEN